MLAAGTTLGPYKISTLIGAGGMGEVYRARDMRSGRGVALKVITSAAAHDPDLLRRFEQEARAVGTLNHPNIIAVHDSGTHEGAPFTVMELLVGRSLRDELGHGVPPACKAIDYAAQVARGLAVVHEQGIVHRDLTPENLFVTRDGHVKILDFGLARLARPKPPVRAGEKPGVVISTDSGTVLGTVGYMAPEQVRGERADARSDLFALGAILYEMLTGRQAFAGRSSIEILAAILNEEPAPLSGCGREMPPGAETIVRRCLEKEPGQRFESAHDLVFTLDAAAGSGGAPRAERGDAAPATRLKRSRLLAVAIVVTLAMAGAATHYWTRHSLKPLVPSYQRVTFRRGTVGSARFTSDGQSVIYSARYVGERWNLYVQRLGTPDARPLGLSGSVVGMVGGEVAILHGDTLSRMPLEGGAPRDIAQGVLRADWGADGSKFAVVRGADEDHDQLECPIGRVLLTNSLGGRHILAPRLSPAGDRVAYIWNTYSGAGDGQVEVVDLARRRQVLSQGWQSVSTLAWSPDGREVWFTGVKKGTIEALHGVTLRGQERLVLKTPGNLGLRDIARDGRLLLVHVQWRWETRGRMAGDSSERDYSWLDGTLTQLLTPDGKQMLFQEAGEGAGDLEAVYLRRNDGNPPVRLCQGSDVGQTRDGKWALVLAGPHERLELRMVPTGAGEAYSLPRGPITRMYWGFLSPDEKHVVTIGAQAGGPERYWIQELPGGTPRPFGPNVQLAPAGPVAGPGPDGRWWACRPGPGAPYMLYSIDGGEPRPIPGLEVEDEPLRWSDDGRWLYSTSPRFRLPIEVTRIDMRTGRREPWLHLAPPDMAGVNGDGAVLNALTPDGRYYGYNYIRSLSDLYLVTHVR